MSPLRRWRLAWRRTQLVTRLSLALGALALVVFAVVGTVMASSMEHYLAGKLDEQMKKSQIQQSDDWKKDKDPKPPWAWTSVMFDMSSGTPVPKRAPIGEPTTDLDVLAKVAAEVHTADEDIYKTLNLSGKTGSYRVRACVIADNTVLVSAAPRDDLDSTLSWFITVIVAMFLLALLVLVGTGRLVLRRGLRPLAEMADTAHDIRSHDLTDSHQLPVRATGAGSGGVEVEELRSAFNLMLEHIDSSLAARTAAEQRLRRFVADASHELRTPLTSIRGYADLFKYAAANEPAERDKHLGRIRHEAARMSVLLDDLLLLARLDAAEVEEPLRLEDIDLVRLATDAADAFRAARPTHHLSLVLAQDALALHADPMRLRQVLDNLLTNAAVHTPPGTEVELAVWVADGTAVLRIADNGPGIPQSDQARIFDRFYRVDDSRSRDKGGSGLGLAVVRSLVLAHGGQVELTSEPGRTMFVLRFPLDSGH
ncbi:two-component system OmpR family sensor kinase [Crossiella equi]|uniref:histidine kinase n=1 Tax=Crossiella equi TaxID=130796 RepID=A0ABS5AC76_9PSEU|nr:HAMP domain-containing sensor histidine kinase [Crossiella equi]MBP2474179.1 two-component system OmpR family sensor kinase [Crossiella equi]